MPLQKLNEKTGKFEDVTNAMLIRDIYGDLKAVKNANAPFHWKVLGGVYKPFSKILYLDANLKRQGFNPLAPVHQKINNVLDKIRPDPETWKQAKPVLIGVGAIVGSIALEAFLQRHRAKEMAREFGKDQPSYSSLARIADPERKRHKPNGSFERHIMQEMDEIDDEYLLNLALRPTFQDNDVTEEELIRRARPTDTFEMTSMAF